MSELKRDSFVFYRSFYESLSELPDESVAKAMRAICDYALNGVEPDLSGIAKAVFILIKPQIDANNKRYINGKAGGRKQTHTKPEPKHNQTVTKVEANANVNDNVNVNDNELSNTSAVAAVVPEKPVEKPIDQHAIILASLLFSLHKEKYDSGYTKTAANLMTWAADIEKIYRVDKRSWGDIEKIIRWCKADAFWYKNIMSGSKLRAQFDTLFAQMNRPTGGRQNVDRSGGISLPDESSMPGWGKP